MPKEKSHMNKGFEPKLKIISKFSSLLELSLEDITLINKCLNTLISPNYSPLDESIYDSFNSYMALLCQPATNYEFEESVIGPLNVEYESFDEAYNSTIEQLDDILKSPIAQVLVNSNKFKKCSNKKICKEFYIQEVQKKKRECIQELSKEVLESPTRNNISFLAPDVLKSWINLMKQNFSLLKPSARNFTLKFIALLSSNINCFLVLLAHGVYNLFWSKYPFQDCKFRCLFVKILNNVLSHREGRNFVTNLKIYDMWKTMVEVEFRCKEINFYYQEVLLDFLLNFTHVPHPSHQHPGVTVTQNFYKFISFFSDKSYVQFNFILKLLQRLLDSCSLNKVAADDMSSIVRCFENLFPSIPKKTEYDLICKYFQVRLYLDRLGMDYDNEIQKPLVDAHYGFIMKMIYNLESLLSIFVLHVHEHKLNREEGFNKWLEYVELCCIIYFSKTPQIQFIPPRCSDPLSNYSPPQGTVDACLSLIESIISLLLFPIRKGLKEHIIKECDMTEPYIVKTSLDSTTDLLFQTLLNDALNTDNSFSAAMKSFACFRRVFPLLEDTLHQHKNAYFDLIRIQEPYQSIWDSTFFTNLSQPQLDMVIEWIRTFEYFINIEYLKKNLSSLIHLLQFDHEEKITQTLLGVMKTLLETVYTRFPTRQSLDDILDIMENTTLSSQFHSKSWIVRDTTLEVLHLEVKLNALRCKKFGMTKEKSLNGKTTVLQFMKYTLVVKQDPDHFVRASAVDLIHTKLMALQDEDTSKEDDLRKCTDECNVDTIRTLVINTLLEICCNELEFIVVQKSLHCLLAIRFKPEEREIGNVVEVAKYFAIKDSQSEMKKIALEFFVCRLNDFFRNFKKPKDSNINTILTDILNATIINFKVILTILFYDEDEKIVSWLCNQLISHTLSKYDATIQDIRHDVLLYFEKEISNIDEIIDIHGSLVFERRIDLDDMPCSVSHSNRSSESSHMIREIVNSHDVELLVSDNKPKHRYFSLHSKKKSIKDKKLLPEFHTKNTFFDESLCTNVDALCIFCNTISKENLWAIVYRRFGIDLHKPDNSYRALKSIFNDILMYDSKKTLIDIKDCY